MPTIKELCPVCTQEMNSTYVMDFKSKDSQINLAGEEIQIEWSKDFCPDCAEMKSKGFILIGAVEEKTTDPKNPYRSGNIWCVENSVAKEMFEPYDPPSSGMAFLDIRDAVQMGLPNVKLDA
jgi:hypothetical protein